jgi:hypothetical protein
MSDKSNQRGGGTGVVLVLSAILLVLPMLYILSIGPLIWLDSKGTFNEPTQTVLGVIYSPLGLAIENEVPVIAPALESYVSLWESPPIAPPAAVAPAGS